MNLYVFHSKERYDETFVAMAENVEDAISLIKKVISEQADENYWSPSERAFPDTYELTKQQYPNVYHHENC